MTFNGWTPETPTEPSTPISDIKEVERFTFRRQNQHSYARHENLEGKVQEFDTFTCAHDNIVVYMNPERKRDRQRCGGCHELLCDPCGRIYQFNKTCMNVRHVIEMMSSIGEETAHTQGIAPFNIDDYHRVKTAEEIQNRRIY